MECKFNYLQGNANLDLKIVLDFFVNFTNSTTFNTLDFCNSFMDETIEI